MPCLPARVVGIALLAGSLAACTATLTDDPPPDAAAVDLAREEDGGLSLDAALDTGAGDVRDAGGADAATIDAGTFDAGPRMDASVAMNAGTRDAGPACPARPIGRCGLPRSRGCSKG